MEIDQEEKSTREKLILLGEKHGVDIDWESAPYKSVKELFQFRNAVAHAETQDVPIEIISGGRGAHVSHWPSFCEPDNAERLRRDVEQIIREFPVQAGIQMPRESLLAEPFEDEDI